MAASSQVPLGSGFGPKTEPTEVLDGVDLTGRIAVVTGGYSGIGLETTRALAKAGASVIVPVRDPEKAAGTLADVAGEVTTIGLDLGDLASVRGAVAELADRLDRIDLLINNAGIMATPEGRVGPGWERQLGVNHIGHFALTTGVLPLLRRAEQPRVVVLSSIAHRRGGIRWDDPHFQRDPYDKWAAYAQSKSANALFALHLSPLLADVGGRANSVHPGGIFTPLQRDLSVDEQIRLGWLAEDGTVRPEVEAIFKSTTQGASTTLWAATSPLLDDAGGVYCEDTDVAALVTADTPAWQGAAPHITDEDDAARLWALTESWLDDA